MLGRYNAGITKYNTLKKDQYSKLRGKTDTTQRAIKFEIFTKDEYYVAITTITKTMFFFSVDQAFKNHECGSTASTRVFIRRQPSIETISNMYKSINTLI